MASRTTAGVGVGVTITLLGVATIGLFVTTIVFLSKYQRVQNEYNELEQSQREFVTAGDRQNDQIRQLAQLARADGGKSVVQYLSDSLQTTMQRTTGVRRDTVRQLDEKLSAIEGAGSTPLLGVIAARDATIASLGDQMRIALDERDAALAQAAGAEERVTKRIARLNEDSARMQAVVDQLRADSTDFDRRLRDAEIDMQRRVDDERQKAEDAQERDAARIRELQDQNLLLADQVAQLRRSQRQDTLRPQEEFALVDGHVVELNPSAGQVYIDLGRTKNIVLGMTFSVYSEAAAIRPDAAGNYPRGKGEIEVIRIGEDSATCRVLFQLPGNPVVKGDVIANAIYDPNKVYKLVVFGNFDTNRDGRATELERHDVEALIGQWGGVVSPEVSGDVDFVVLGQRPVLPPEPSVSDPIEVVNEYVRLQREQTRYDELFRQAQASSIPVMNQNRLYTLIGRTTSRLD